MPSATSASTERNTAEPLIGPSQLLGQLAHRAPAQLDGVRDHRPDVPQLSELPGGIGHRPGRQSQAHRADRRNPGRHPARPVQPDEAGAQALPAGRYQHVDYVHGGSAPDAWCIRAIGPVMRLPGPA